VMIINKIDLLPYVEFDLDRCIEYARRVNPDIEVIQLSASKGEGLAQWYDWIELRRDHLGKSIGAHGAPYGESV